MSNTTTKVPTTTEFMKEAVYTDKTMFGGGRMGIANMINGGQLGHHIRLTDIDAATPLVFNPSIFIVTHAPGIWKEYPEMQEMWKSLVETHAKSITGVDFGYQLQTEETPVGHDGQTQKVPTRSTRTQISPTITFQEVTGNLVWNLIRMWINDIQHADTNASKLSAQLSGEQVPAWLMSAYSFSMVGIMPDPTGRYDRIIDAAFYTNMFPTDTTELGIQRVINTTEIKERAIPFTGIVQHNANTKLLGVNIMRMLQQHKVAVEHALPGLSGTVHLSGLDPAAITPAISGFGLRDQTLGDRIGAVEDFNPLGADQYTDTYLHEPHTKESVPSSGDVSGIGGDGFGKTAAQMHAATSANDIDL